MNAMSKQYIERYWRNATPEDAIKDPPMVARFRDKPLEDWVVNLLRGIDRAEGYWFSDGNAQGGRIWWHCQVYDAPDPGEGWRLIDVESETKQEGDEYLRTDGTWRMADSAPFCHRDIYRRRITPVVKYVPFTWEDREELRGRWVTWKHENGMGVEVQINHINEQRNGGLFFKSRDGKWLLDNATFVDTGEPVGRKVTQ